MRIMLVTDTPYPDADPAGRGVTTTLKALADRLIDTGHHVGIIAAAPGLATYKRSAVVRVNPLTKPGAQIRDVLAAAQPDLAIVVDPGRMGRKALKHARRQGVHTVVVQQRPVSATAEEYWRMKVAGRADDLFVTATWMVERITEAGVQADLWLPGVDALAFTPALRDPWLHSNWSHAKREPKIVVGYAGGLTNRHGVRRLAELNELPGVRPVIIGDGPQAGWLKGHLPHARFTGPLSTGHLAVALATLDVLVHPGEDETCCHVLREASASGVPVVAPRAGGAAEVVQHLESGLLYDPHSDGALADAVGAVVADPQRALLGVHGRALALARDWHTAVDELMARVTEAGVVPVSAR